MAARFANCPNCGGQVEFKAGSSLLAVCGYCQSCVVRVGDDITELELLGKVSPLANVASPLYLGISGRYEKKSFTIVGRLQLDYGLGPWNEWYATFDDGTWGWIAEAQGRIYVLFGRELSGLPPYSHWRVGTKFQIGGKRFTVTERRKARFTSAEGELPFAVAPGSELKYCDIEGEDRAFGTLDFGDGEALESVFVGVETEYAAIFSKADLRDTEAPAAATVGLNCPSCGAALALKAPDEAQRVTCPSCTSVLDCGSGELKLVQAARQKLAETPIPLGAKGIYKGKSFEVYGQIVRSVVVEGIEYAWDEYLLRTQDRAWRWLVESNGHYSFVEPVSSGALRGDRLSPTFAGKSFKLFQSASARVRALRGEFYWKVAVGDLVSTADFVNPPLMLSRETTHEEESWSLATYLTPKEVTEIFKLRSDNGTLRSAPQPRGISPNQPNPHTRTRGTVLKLAALYTLLLALFAFGVKGRSVELPVYSAATALVKDPKRAEENIIVTPPFEIPKKSNLEITVSADVSNSWFFLGGALISEDDGTVREFGVDVAYYHGYSGGESWSEGGPADSHFLGAVDPGRYVLRLEPQWDTTGYKLSGAQGLAFASRYTINVRSDVFLPSHALAFGGLLWIFPIIIVALHSGFEKRRWADSDFAPGGED
ncbi:MAG: DUF4178 domain-containing protein [Deltaproteobacteria bacterium]|nr:DUF4178 domain-containing protein [Deltaproteobacteria bacterium]